MHVRGIGVLKMRRKIALGRSGENVSQVEGAVGMKVLRQEWTWRVWGTKTVQVWLG